ncbi:hypothetical protein LX32DRAFT_640830, partial [Colletotrichum zoysiae]
MYGYGLLHSATDTSSAGYFGRRPKNDRTILPTKSNSSRSDDSQFLQSKLVSTSKSTRRLIGSTTLVSALKQLANPCVRHTGPFSSILIPSCLDLLTLHMPTATTLCLATLGLLPYSPADSTKPHMITVAKCTDCRATAIDCLRVAEPLAGIDPRYAAFAQCRTWIVATLSKIASRRSTASWACELRLWPEIPSEQGFVRPTFLIIKTIVDLRQLLELAPWAIRICNAALKHRAAL